MSASLVGSEMCIRDRMNNVQEMSRTSSCAAMRIKRQWHWRVLHGSTRIAVSYTHLTLPTICSV
eukprot:11431205-Alexandrium_andersonii.AAC.1